MHVDILPPGTSTPVRLTGERPEEGVDAGVLTPRRSQEMVELVESPQAEGLDYRNQSHTFEFSITRTWPTAGAAAHFHLLHAQNVPPAGRVKFIVTEQDGSLYGDVYLEEAIITVTRAVWETCATTVSYRVAGGRMTTS